MILYRPSASFHVTATNSMERDEERFILHSSGPWKVQDLGSNRVSVEDLLPGMQVVPSQCILTEWRQILTLLCPLLWNIIQLLSSSLLGQIILQRSHLDTHSDWSYSAYKWGADRHKNSIHRCWVYQNGD